MRQSVTLTLTLSLPVSLFPICLLRLFFLLLFCIFLSVFFLDLPTSPLCLYCFLSQSSPLSCVYPSCVLRVPVCVSVRLRLSPSALDVFLSVGVLGLCERTLCTPLGFTNPQLGVTPTGVVPLRRRRTGFSNWLATAVDRGSVGDHSVGNR